jgi:2-dehydropantoate 2-reductase
LEEGRVRHAAPGRTVFGAWTSCPAELAYKVFRDAGFEVMLTDTPGQVIWEKAAINAGINPLTALLDVPNGRLLEMADVRQLLRDLVLEATKVAATEGYRFQQSLVEAAENLCRQTKDNISSMLQDVRSRKKTEIRAISGEILRRAQAASLPTPRTRVIYQLVRGLENR